MVKIIGNTYSIGNTFVDTDDGDEYLLVGVDYDEVVLSVTSGDFVGRILGTKCKVDDMRNITYDELDDISNGCACDLESTTGFKPVSFVIETEDELKELWMRYLLSASQVNDGIYSNYRYTVKENDTWYKINDKCNEFGMKDGLNVFRRK